MNGWIEGIQNAIAYVGEPDGRFDSFRGNC